MMQHPVLDVDAWIELAVENKSSWKQLHSYWDQLKWCNAPIVTRV